MSAESGRSRAVGRLFSQEDLDRIAEAVGGAERKTSGEIVPRVVDRSDLYEEAVWRGGFGFGLTALALLVSVRLLTEAWLPVDRVTIGLAALASGCVGMGLVSLVPAMKRLFAGDGLMERRVAQRAAEAFVANEVFDTRNRTGILIFVSLLERRVVVVGDSGINAKVEPQAWEDIVGRVVTGIRAGRPVDGLLDAIRQSGILLEQHGLRIQPGDTDELPNALRTEEGPP
jgi:putative membrane protein